MANQFQSMIVETHELATKAMIDLIENDIKEAIWRDDHDFVEYLKEEKAKLLAIDVARYKEHRAAWRERLKRGYRPSSKLKRG